MDVFKSLLGAAAILTLAACSPSRSADTVFDTYSSSECQGQKVENKFIVHWVDGSFTYEKGVDAESFKRDFITPNLDRIHRVDFDRKFRFQAEAIRSTATARQQGSSNDWGQQIIEAPALWAQGVQGQGVTVGIVDSYVDITHPQLAARVAVNTGEIANNGIDDDGNGYIDDVNGFSFISTPGSNQTVNDHGTHVTGIVLSEHVADGAEGVAPQAKFVAAPFITNDGSGNLEDAIRALDYVAARGVRVVNASWGGAPCVPILRDAFAKLTHQGILMVVAAGNSARDLDRVAEYPASFSLDAQITVAASTSSDYKASFSNSGYNFVHLAAPGVGILSTVPNNGLESMDGTSMAAPFVTGAAALLFGARPNATALQVKEALMKSVDVISGHEYRVMSRGRLNVRKAYEELLKIIP